jgi:hypothetical protein
MNDIKQFKNQIDDMQAAAEPKTFRLDLVHAADGTIEISNVKKLSKQVSPDIQTWDSVDKRAFTRGFLNNVQRFITK